MFLADKTFCASGSDFIQARQGSIENAVNAFVDAGW
jgi:hypothetical protein